MIFQSSWIMMVIRIITENRAVDCSNQPNPKSYTLRKLALDKESFFQSLRRNQRTEKTKDRKKCRIIQYNVPKASINVLRIHFHHTGLLLLKFDTKHTFHFELFQEDTHSYQVGMWSNQKIHFYTLLLSTIYRVFMMESTKSKQLLWDFLLKDHMVSWVNLIGIKRPFCETKSDFWYSGFFFRSILEIFLRGTP